MHSFNPKYSDRVNGSLRALRINPWRIHHQVVCPNIPIPRSDGAIKFKMRKKKVKLSTDAQGIWSWQPEVLWTLLERAKNNYNIMIRKYHPDRFPNASEKELALHSTRAAIVNNSWSVVKNLFAKHGYTLEK